jgi:hypothetical protein
LAARARCDRTMNSCLIGKARFGIEREVDDERLVLRIATLYFSSIVMASNSTPTRHLLLRDS